jgi:hypothetical protein
MSARSIGQSAGSVISALGAALNARKAANGSSPRSGQPVWRNSYYEGQLEDRLWRPVGLGKQRGTRRGASRLAGAVMKAAKALDRRTRIERKAKTPGLRNGALGEIGIAVLEALYSLVDYATGRLEPAIATLAERTGYSYSAVHNALGRLRAAGFLKWIRRSRPTENKGEAGPQVEQISNAYALTIPVEFQDYVERLVGDGPTPDCEQWRREQAGKDLEALIASVSASRFHRDFWNGDKLTGESFAAIAEALDRQERESSRAGETGGSS